MKQHYLLLSFLLSGITLRSQTSVMPPGNGTYADPYLISTAQHLYWMSQTPSAWSNQSNYTVFRQVADIDASETINWNGGQGFTPIGSHEPFPISIDQSFYGVYQGQGYSINNITINRYLNSSNLSSIGLFGSIGGGSVSNLKITNSAFTLQDYFTDDIKTGIFCGRLSGASVEHVIVSGSVINAINTPDNIVAGGLIGLLNDAAVMNCGAETVYIYTDNGVAGGLAGMGGGGRTIAGCYATGEIYGQQNAGGLFGIYSGYGSGVLKDSYANCMVGGGPNGAGGLIGKINGGTVNRTYAAGNVAGANITTMGGLIGTGSYTMVANSYFDQIRAGTAASAGGTGLLSNELRNVNTFLAGTYDFVCETANGLNDYWVIRADTNNGYPYLKWAGSPYSDNCRIWYGHKNSVASEPANWSFNTVPTPGSSVMIHHTAARDLVADASYQWNVIYFANNNVKIVLGPWDLTAKYTMWFNRNAYVKTNGTGKLIMTLHGGTSGYEGQVGIGNSTLNDVMLTNNTGSDDVFDFRVLDEVYENGISGPVKYVQRVKRTWLINKGNGNAIDGSGVNIQLKFQDGSIDGGPTGSVKPKINHYSNGAWEVATGMFNSFSEYPASMGGGGYASLFMYKGGFSPFSIMLASQTLPVQWAGFSAKLSGNNALLNWSTASEQNTSQFTVLHSFDGSNWRETGVVKAKGNSGIINQYQFIHNGLASGKNFYRLRQEDQDGQFSFSKIITLDVPVQLSAIKVNGNPVTNGQLQVLLPQSQEVNLLNTAAQLMLRKQLPAGNNIISVAHLPAGVYYLKTASTTIQILIK